MLKFEKRTIIQDDAAMVQNLVEFKQNVYMQSFYLSYHNVFPLNILEKVEIVGYEKLTKLFQRLSSRIIIIMIICESRYLSSSFIF